MIKLKARHIAILLAYAVPNTLLSFAILYIINKALAGNEEFVKDYMSIVFISLIVYTYLINIVFQKWLNKFSFKLLYDNEKKVFSQILKARLQKLEKLGSNRFFTAVEDLRTFSLLPFTITHTVNSVLMLILCLVYMFTISFTSALIVVGLIIGVAVCYFIVMNSMSKQVERLRLYNEDYYKYVDDVIRGFKELKLNFFRRENLMNKFLIPNRNDAEKLDFRINYIFLSINLISQYGLYFIIAVILFLLPSFNLLEREDVIAYVVIILFISGPINNLINLQQMYTRFMVANSRIKRFIEDFELVSEMEVESSFNVEPFKRLKFDNVKFTYENTNQNASSFSIGPIDLEVFQGETLFVVGGNGSGKSTFINLLTGLYHPGEGNILLNDHIFKSANRNVQDYISAVFTDNHIFSHNYDSYSLKNNGDYLSLLERMRLNEIIDDDEEESARRKFSKGQSKRMSLIFALLEDKPILVLDEWAADQDPHFRKYFYEELLPIFKQQGKTIIAVTHDDAYFHYADRVIKFDYGQIVKDVDVQSKEKLATSLWV